MTNQFTFNFASVTSPSFLTSFQAKSSYWITSCTIFAMTTFKHTTSSIIAHKTSWKEIKFVIKEKILVLYLFVYCQSGSKMSVPIVFFVKKEIKFNKIYRFYIFLLYLNKSHQANPQCVGNTWKIICPHHHENDVN